MKKLLIGVSLLLALALLLTWLVYIPKRQAAQAVASEAVLRILEGIIQVTPETIPGAIPGNITDDLGRTVYIAKVPERIVSLAPSITEVLFATGLGDTVVGVTEDDDYPEEAKTKPKVGRYFSATLEAIVALNPGLVFTDGHDPVGQQLENLGQTMVVLQPKDIAGVLRDIALIGKIGGKENEAGELITEMKQRIAQVVSTTVTATRKPSVFYEIDATDSSKPWTAGPGSFIDALIALAGGKNIVKTSGAWLQLSIEEVISADPDIIILGDYPYVKPEQVKERGAGWQNLTAVKSGKVHAISDPSLTSRPGPRLVDGLEELARAIHPELFR